MSSPQQQQQQQQQIMNSPQQQLMASPQQQQQTANTPGPSPGGQQNQQNNNVAGASPMNTMNAMGMNNMSTINMSAMNSIMNNQGMAGMTMTSMNPGGFQQSMGHPGMTSNAMPQVFTFLFLGIGISRENRFLKMDFLFFSRFKLFSSNFHIFHNFTVTLRGSSLSCRVILHFNRPALTKLFR